MTKSEEYNPQETIILHDKYIEIKREMEIKKINVSTNAEYTKIIIHEYIILFMKIMDGKIIYRWKISQSDNFMEYFCVFILVVLNWSYVADVILGKRIYGIYYDINIAVLIFMDILFLLFFFASLVESRDDIKWKKEYLNYIIAELSAKNLIS